MPSVEDKEVIKVHGTFKNILSDIKNSSNTKQLAVGSVSGLVTGYVTMKIGKTAAVAVGSGIILLQLAQNNGYIAIDWKKFKSNANKTKETIDVDTYVDGAATYYTKVVEFAKTNTIFATGFLGGFFIGLSF